MVKYATFLGVLENQAMPWAALQQVTGLATFVNECLHPQNLSTHNSASSQWSTRVLAPLFDVECFENPT
jgi:hypothetical protein